MKNILYLSFLFILFIACSSKRENEIFLFNNIYLNTLNEEEISPIDLPKKDMFTSYFSDTTLQIPLFKIIKSTNYTIYIGLPFNTNLKQMSNLAMAPTLVLDTLTGKTSADYSYKAFTNSKEKVITYSKNFNGNWVFVLITTQSVPATDSLFNFEKLSSRFIIK